jgi:hypothetical protein
MLPNKFELIEKEAVEHLKDTNNVTIHKGSSPDVMKNIISYDEKNLLVFLDAHWEDYWPVNDELKVLYERNVQPVICIHDFFVPNKNGGAAFGFDKYGDQKLDLDYIKDFLNEIYGEGKYDYYYNSESDNVGQGVIYIYKNDIGTN